MSEKDVKLAHQYHFKYLYDQNFQEYAFLLHAESLGRILKHCKLLHFSSTAWYGPAKKVLTGSVYNLQMFNLALAGLTGTEEEIYARLNGHGGHLNNHLTSKNNIEFGNFVINEIENYSPGIKDIDLSAFEVLNPNALNWPNRYWGSV